MSSDARGDVEPVKYWNEVLAPKFIRFKHILEGGLAHHSEAVFPNLPVKPGDTVLDLGCGFGDTTLKLARRVGPTGRVLGVDCCEAFLHYGAKAARQEALDNVIFVCSDIQSMAFEPRYDFVFSRFGTLFFANPVVALRNIRGAMKPGATLTQIVWRSPYDNPWVSIAKEVVLGFLPPVGEDSRSCGPGPFSMANQAMVTEMMTAAGYEDIAFERVDALVLVGKTLQEAIDFQLAVGPASEVFREAGAVADERRAEIEAALAEAITAERKPRGS